MSSDREETKSGLQSHWCQSLFSIHVRTLVVTNLVHFFPISSYLSAQLDVTPKFPMPALVVVNTKPVPSSIWRMTIVCCSYYLIYYS